MKKLIVILLIACVECGSTTVTHEMSIQGPTVEIEDCARYRRIREYREYKLCTARQIRSAQDLFNSVVRTVDGPHQKTENGEIIITEKTCRFVRDRVRDGVIVFPGKKCDACKVRWRKLSNRFCVTTTIRFPDYRWTYFRNGILVGVTVAGAGWVLVKYLVK